MNSDDIILALIIFAFIIAWIRTHWTELKNAIIQDEEVSNEDR